MSLVGKLHIDGIFEGRISSVDSVTVGRRGVVKGVIRAHQVSVCGRVDGEVYCDELTIERGGQVQGLVHSRQMTIHKRGNFIGERDLTTESSLLPGTTVTAVVLDEAVGGADNVASVEQADDSKRESRQPEQLTRMLDEMLGELPKVGKRPPSDSH